MTLQTRSFLLGGGLNLVTPAINKPQGNVIAGVNYEPVTTGYRRIDGFERFDGRPRPSRASYWVLPFASGIVAVTAGQTVTGATSGATGVALIDAVVESGWYDGGNAAGYLVLTALTGEFVENEILTVGGDSVSVALGTAAEKGATTDAEDIAWMIAAIERARAEIERVPGSGPIRGVWVYGGDAYAFRDDEGGTAGRMWKATPAGWALQSFGQYLRFKAGTAEFAEGGIVTGATSGAKGTILRVVHRAGAWTAEAADATGLLMLTGVTGTFQNGETITGSGGSAKADGTLASITLPAGGRYECVNHNFYGASNLLRMYFVNGVGHACEWDGSMLVPIFTGMAEDKPTHIAINKQHLFLAFRGGSIQHSGIGDPYAWSPILGAGEIGLGEDVTGFVQDYAKVLTIIGRNKVAALYGNDATDWQLEPLSDDSGGVEWTAQKIGVPVYLDDGGLRALNTTQQYGDFKIGTLTQLVEPIFALKKRAGARPIASLRVRAKDQYRLFWDDGTGLTVYFGGKNPEILPFNLGLVARVCCSSEERDGSEILLLGSDDGFVYQLDAGTSLDGEAVEAYVRLPFNHLGSPMQKKRWHKATLELDAAPSSSLMLVAEFDYANPDQPPSQEHPFTVTGSGGFWDESVWDNFYWSAAAEGIAEAHLDGLGKNASIVVASRAAYEEPHTLHGLTLHFSYRGLQR